MEVQIESTITNNNVKDINKDINLVELVKNATWKELLIELVETNQIDPWDIDIAKVVENYINVIKQMEFFDLRIPANIILAASILLYMKSLSFKLIEEPVIDIEDQSDNIAGRVVPEVPQLINKIRIQPNRKITLFELMEALEEAIKIKQDREIKITKEPEPLVLEIATEDIDEKMENVYKMINIYSDSTKMVTFSNLSKEFLNSNKNKSILIDLFIPILFLAHKEKIIIFQDAFFGEIFIHLNNAAK